METDQEVNLIRSGSLWLDHIREDCSHLRITLHAATQLVKTEVTGDTLFTVLAANTH